MGRPCKKSICLLKFIIFAVIIIKPVFNIWNDIYKYFFQNIVHEKMI